MIFVFIFLFGLCAGSFLNVLICRLGGAGEKESNLVLQQRSILCRIGGRSRCQKCAHQLGWRDLVPVLSFLILRGRCRYCGEKISWQYPLVEMATGLLFVFIFASVLSLEFGDRNLGIGNLVNILYLLFIVSCLIVVFVSDLKYFIIPDEIIIAGVIGAFLYKILNSYAFFSKSSSRFLPVFKGTSSIGAKGVWEGLYPYLLVALGASAFFLLVVVATKGKGMGLGDVKLAFLMGLILGWPQILAAALLAFVSGAIVGLGLIFLGRAKMKSEIPFGTFLSASTFLILLLLDGNILNLSGSALF